MKSPSTWKYYWRNFYNIDLNLIIHKINMLLSYQPPKRITEFRFDNNLGKHTTTKMWRMDLSIFDKYNQLQFKLLQIPILFTWNEKKTKLPHGNTTAEPMQDFVPYTQSKLIGTDQSSDSVSHSWSSLQHVFIVARFTASNPQLHAFFSKELFWLSCSIPKLQKMEVFFAINHMHMYIYISGSFLLLVFGGLDVLCEHSWCYSHGHKLLEEQLASIGNVYLHMHNVKVG